MNPDCESKKAYTRKEAVTALKQIKKRSRHKNQARRMYRCPDCRSWHLTSQSKRSQDGFRRKKKAESRAACKSAVRMLGDDGTCGDGLLHGGGVGEILGSS